MRSIGWLALLLACGGHAQGTGPPAQSIELLNDVFQEHAVLQRDQPIAVWGRAQPGEWVTVTLAASNAKIQADSRGLWRVTLPAMSTGGPHVLSAMGATGSRRTAGDILIGDVFLCSGQSNMELPVLRAGDSWNEVRTSANDTLRMVTIPHALSPAPLADFQNALTWQIAAPETVPDWSATCFFFARELQKAIHVPIGLIHASWGGSNIRPWMSAGTLRAAGYGPALDTLALYATDQSAAQAQFARQWQEWWRGRTGDRPGEEPWNSPGGNWLAAPTGLGDWRRWPVAELKDFTGLLWYRTHVTLTAAQARTAETLTLGAINQVDETWINGRAVGNTFGYGTPRTYPLTAGMLHQGDNVLVVNVLSTYGGGGLLEDGPTRALHLAGGESIPLDGAWEYRIVPPTVGYPPRAPWESVGGLSTLYNAMIAPLGSFGLRGVLWYQGESNTGEAGGYLSLLAGLMTDWRSRFGAQLPFLVVQLPNFGPPPMTPEESGWSEVREAQRLAVANDAHAGLAVTIDIGDAHNLHPPDKQEVGKRLARAARHVIYGESISPSGPAPLSAVQSAGAIALTFGGLEQGLGALSHDGPIGFELCERAPATCRYTEARIEGASVLLATPQGMAPTRVRYCWGNSPVCTLVDRSGLPAVPFELPIGH
jgi:sialate O-acetylesterase